MLATACRISRHDLAQDQHLRQRFGRRRELWQHSSHLASTMFVRAFSAAQGHIRGLAAVTANTRAHGAPFRHMLFYGPPGARCSATLQQCAAASRGCAL